jgi:hypothetical protein
MAEAPEIDTDKLREAIDEEIERESKGFLRRIALTTALLAAFAALASLQAGANANEALLKKTEAARLQGEISDKWGYYQAQRIKAAIQEAARSSWLAAGKEPPPVYAEKEQKYETEKATLEHAARELEKQRDEQSLEADHLFHRHHWFAYAVTLLQVAISLGAVAALTRMPSIWFGSLGIGLGGVGLWLFALGT